MLAFLFHILLLCLSTLTWLLLTLVGYALLRYRRRSPALLLSGIVVVALWVITTFNVWYEGLILTERLSLVSSPNSWGFVLLTPLFYLYYRLLLTGQMPGRRQWLKHLFLPGVLLLVYLVAALVSPVPDKLVYSWYDFRTGWPSWWGVFRLSCYVLLAGQLAVYLPRLFGTAGVAGKQTRQALHLRREMLLVLAFCGVALAGMLIPFSLFRLLYTLALARLAVYLLTNTPIYRLSKTRLGRYLIPDPPRPQAIAKASAFQMTVASIKQMQPTIEPTPAELPVYLSAKQEALLEELIRQHLGNPHLTLKFLARELCTNQTYLGCYFRHQRHTHFSKYLGGLRLDEAERLLLHTDLPIITIAERIGFQTTSGFYTAFATRHSVPPAHFRKR